MDDGDDGDAEAALLQHLEFMAIITRKQVATEDGLEQSQEVSLLGSRIDTPYLATSSQSRGKKGAKWAKNVPAGPGVG